MDSNSLDLSLMKNPFKTEALIMLLFPLVVILIGIVVALILVS